MCSRRSRLLVAVMTCVFVLGVTARARADGDDEPNVRRAFFTTNKTADGLRAEACSLTGAFRDGGRGRTWDVSVNGKRCSSLPPGVDSVPLAVTIEDVTVENSIEIHRRRVLLEGSSSDVPDEMLERAVTSTAISLRDARPPQIVWTPPVEAPKQKASHGHAQGAAIAAAATAGGLLVVGLVVLAFVAVGGMIALFAALGSAFSKL